MPFSLVSANSGDGICIPSLESSLLWRLKASLDQGGATHAFPVPFQSHVLSTLMVYTSTGTRWLGVPVQAVLAFKPRPNLFHCLLTSLTSSHSKKKFHIAALYTHDYIHIDLTEMKVCYNDS